MEFLLGILGIFIVITFFLPWFQGRRISNLEERIESLSRQLDNLSQRVAFGRAPEPQPAPPPTPEPQPVTEPEPVAVTLPAPASVPSAGSNVVYSDEPIATEASSRDSFELNFGAKLPVWIGGIALAFAGFYLVRYSIEMDLIGPGLQVLLGLLFGAGLITGAYRVGPRQARIGQSLAGAGIAVIYCALFVASSVYDLISPLLCLMAMSANTALAVIMATRHGAPIAMLGMIGGFLTPLLTGSDSGSTPLLLAYIYVLFTALFWFIRQMQWWFLLILLTPLGLVWALFVLFFIATSSEFIYVSLFLIALCITVIQGTRNIAEELSVSGTQLTTGQLGRYMNYAVLGVAAVLTGIATARSGFGSLELGLMLLLTAGSVALAWLDRRSFAFAPVVALLVNVVMLFYWRGADPDLRLLVIGMLAALYGGAGSWLVWRSGAALFWAFLSSTGLALLYLTAWILEHGTIMPRVAIWPYISFPFWGLLGLLLADLMVHQARRVRRYVTDSAEVQKLLAVFAAAAVGFFTLGLAIELKKEFLSIALAAEVLALSYLNTRLDVKALRALVILVSFAFAFVLLPQIALLLQLGVYSLIEARLYIQDSLPMVRWPLAQLGLPALLFVGATLCLRQQKDDKLVAVLEVAAIALLGLMGYYLMRHAMHPGDDILFRKAGFIERGTFTNILFVFALACFYTGQRWLRPAVSLAALALTMLAAFRLFWFDLVIHNPLFNYSQRVGERLLANGVTLTYGLPVLWLHFILTFSKAQEWPRLLRFVQMTAVFAFITLTVRHFYHGNTLTGHAGNAEMYTYSFVWLVIGLLLLVQGTRRNDRTMRIASLVLVTLTVGKVFLIDAAQLKGLWRVVSFLGLGVSLLGISWFYNRFIFRRDA